MCGRFAFYSTHEAVTELFGVEFPLAFEPRYNIAPTQYVAAIRLNDERQAEGVMLRWGLVPSWARDPAIGNRMINARAETIAEKPAFRAAFKRRRCVVLADGFYEWQAGQDGKQPFYIHAADDRPLALAGLWEHWDKGDEPLQTCTLITTRANRFMSELHDRMPVVLDAAHYRDWLERPDPGLLEPGPEGLLKAHPVSRAVNNPKHEGEELIQSG
jgi:putative SOS response-associated peptidase YedK